jgi:hypothetical protein
MLLAMGRKRRSPIGATTPQEAEEQLAHEIRWRARWAGISSRGAEERAKQLASLPPQPPELTPAPKR